jgi:putative MFS transporter
MAELNPPSARYLSPAANIAARLDRLPPSRTVWTIVVLISLGGVFEFYDLFFTGYVTPAMVSSGLFQRESLGLFARLSAMAISGAGTFVFCTFLGLWLGILLLSQVCDRLGRRTVFTWSLVWYALCTAIMAFQRSGQSLNVWRFLAGIGVGVQLVTIDTYVSELVAPGERGRAFCANQAISFAAVPIVALLAWLLSPLHPLGLDGWRWVVLIGSSGAVLVWLLRGAIPESPRWLALQGRVQQAEVIVQELERRVAAEQAGPLPPPQPVAAPDRLQVRFREIFGREYGARTLMLSLFNIAQVIGFYGFASWVPTLLMGRGITVTHSLEYSFIIAIANPFGPLLGMAFADRIERKTQIILSMLSMGILMAAFALVSNAALLILVGALFTLAANIMSYAYHGYQAELYPTRVRARAIGFVYSWSRLASAFAGLAIGYLLRTGGVALVAAFIGIAMAVGIALMGLFGPRTRGLALERAST